MAKIAIDYKKCEGADCAECVDICPMEIFEIQGEKTVVTKEDECSLCETCMDICPNSAVNVDEEE